MTAIDWLIVAFTVLLALYGFMQGFIVGALSVAGFAIGAFLGTRLGPLLLPGGSRSPYAPLFGLAGALLAGGILASGFEGLGLYARGALKISALRTLDGLLGAVLTACVALGVVWIVGTIALDSSGSSGLRRDIRRSVILRELNAVLPPSAPILGVLARIDPLPSVHGPAAGVGPPTRAILADPAVQAAENSVVRVVGTACGLGVEGSGWVAAPGVVVTNAHVVAGESDTTVQVKGIPPNLPARAIAFDSHNDIAILHVDGLSAPPLSLAGSAPGGTAAAILGFPLDGPLNLQPGRVGQTEPVSTEDAYGNGPVTRTITALRGLVRPGNSGGPMIDDHGHVAATVFAAITGSARHGGFAVPDRLVARALAIALRRQSTVGTGPCAG